MSRDDHVQVCLWCEKTLSRRKSADNAEIFCGRSCRDDSIANKWPSWVTGRIGELPPSSIYERGGFLCLSAPNKYRQAHRKKICPRIEEMQAEDFPHLSFPAGIDIDPITWDQILIWKKQNPRS